MKLQGVAIIFIMIAFPLILVLSYYLGMQIDTIKLQTDYDNKLIDATYDSLAAFEINTANEDLSAASDSLRSIVNASATTFTNTLGTSLGLSNASKERIREYIPAMLFTLYDGYYIYAPTEVPEILEKSTTVDGVVTSEGAIVVGDEKFTDIDNDGIVEDGETEYYDEEGELLDDPPLSGQSYGSIVYWEDEDRDGIKEPGEGSININDAYVKKKQDYVLKSYMPYSATYIEPGTNNTATINYTLDNFMSISGTIDGVYYTKSGYYINQGLVSEIVFDDGFYPPTTISAPDVAEKIYEYGQDKLKKDCESGQYKLTLILDGVTDSIEYDSTISMEEREKALEVEYKNYQSLITANPIDMVQVNNSLDNIRNIEEELSNLKAIIYYLTNTAFSYWVNNNLDFVKGENLINDDADLDIYEVSELTDDGTNIYYNFENDVEEIFNDTTDPEDSDSVFNNHKYNIIKNAVQHNLNSAISTYNEKYVSSQEFRMPMLTENEWEQITGKVSIVSFMQGLPCGTKTYTGYSVVSSTNNELTVTPEEIYYLNRNEFNDETAYYHRIDCPLFNPTDTISFKSKEVKYDKIYDKHNNRYNYDHKNLACYNCIVQNNYENDSSDIDGDGSNYMSFQDYIENMHANRKKAYYIAVGKERQNLYKTTGYSRNEGVRTAITNTITLSDDILKAEVTIEVTHPDGIVQNFSVDGNVVGRISTSTRSKQTIETFVGGNIDIPTTVVGGTTVPVFQVLSVKYIYK